IASHCESQCCSASNTIRTARPRSSTGYFPGLFCSVMTPSSQGLEPARYSGRFNQLTAIAPQVAERLQAMEPDLLAYTAFPPGHWAKIWSNNPIERLNRELKRRTDVVGIFPNTDSVIRLVGALLVEINDEMIAAERRYISAASITPLLEKGDQLASLPAAPRN